jgi:hypothetical protein
MSLCLYCSRAGTASAPYLIECGEDVVGKLDLRHRAIPLSRRPNGKPHNALHLQECRGRPAQAHTVWLPATCPAGLKVLIWRCSSCTCSRVRTCSDSGVLNTRSRPNLSSRPRLHMKTPPKATSSPKHSVLQGCRRAEAGDCLAGYRHTQVVCVPADKLNLRHLSPHAVTSTQ